MINLIKIELHKKKHKTEWMNKNMNNNIFASITRKLISFWISVDKFFKLNSKFVKCYCRDISDILTLCDTLKKN